MTGLIFWIEMNFGLSGFFPKAIIPCRYLSLIASKRAVCAADIFPEALDKVFLSDESSAISEPNDSIWMLCPDSTLARISTQRSQM